MVVVLITEQWLIEAQVRTYVDQCTSITLASVHVVPYDRLKVWCEDFGSSFFSLTHLNGLFCVQPWDAFRIFECYLHPTLNKNMFGDGSGSLHFYNKKPSPKCYKPIVWSYV